LSLGFRPAHRSSRSSRGSRPSELPRGDASWRPRTTQVRMPAALSGVLEPVVPPSRSSYFAAVLGSFCRRGIRAQRRAGSGAATGTGSGAADPLDALREAVFGRPHPVSRPTVSGTVSLVSQRGRSSAVLVVGCRCSGSSPEKVGTHCPGRSVFSYIARSSRRMRSGRVACRWALDPRSRPLSVPLYGPTIAEGVPSETEWPGPDRHQRWHPGNTPRARTSPFVPSIRSALGGIARAPEPYSRRRSS